MSKRKPKQAAQIDKPGECSAGPMKIAIGLFAKPLADQLNGSGIAPEIIAHLQADADAMTRLVVRGYVTDAQRVAMQRKFFKKVQIKYSAAIAKARGKAVTP